MSTTIQDILETRQDELRQLLDKTSSRITSQEHTKRIPHANHCYRNATNRTTTTTKGSVRSMKIRRVSMIAHIYVSKRNFFLAEMVFSFRIKRRAKTKRRERSTEQFSMYVNDRKCFSVSGEFGREQRKRFSVSERSFENNVVSARHHIL